MSAKLGVIGPETPVVISEVNKMDYAEVLARRVELEELLANATQESVLLDKLVEDSILSVEEAKQVAESSEEEANRIASEKIEAEKVALAELESKLADVQKVIEAKTASFDSNKKTLAGLKDRIQIAEARKNPELFQQMEKEKAEATIVKQRQKEIEDITTEFSELKTDVETWIYEFEEFVVNREIVLEKEEKTEWAFIRNNYELVKDDCFADYFHLIDNPLVEEEEVKSLARKTKGALDRLFSLIQNYGEKYLGWKRGEKRRSGRPVKPKNNTGIMQEALEEALSSSDEN